MTTQQIAAMIASIGLPNAYYQFENTPQNPAPDPPFICFFYPADDDFKADNINYVQINQLIIELYTDDKRFDLENRIHDILTANELDYTRQQSYIDDEHMYQTSYTMEVCLNAPDGE